MLTALVLSHNMYITTRTHIHTFSPSLSLSLPHTHTHVRTHTTHCSIYVASDGRCINMYIHTSMYIYICMCIHMYTYIHISITNTGTALRYTLKCFSLVYSLPSLLYTLSLSGTSSKIPQQARFLLRCFLCVKSFRGSALQEAPQKITPQISQFLLLNSSLLASACFCPAIL